MKLKTENSNGALILDTLAEDGVNDTIKEEKYIPPKTRTTFISFGSKNC